ncbi:mechanosensitive ion channel family protein [Halomarina oriensis]|uniref:Mechanosensitive ion channel n=1 Tax=Halomarina oriensis TaxID=671145 RepID=A0A6B0GNY4_9EURY|nr:mechanosensitive ion channel family protein [Halomarina oriensis]MWG35671.1 mechanosensitive ion channel [Halomarina oriensis]
MQSGGVLDGQVNDVLVTLLALAALLFVGKLILRLGDPLERRLSAESADATQSILFTVATVLTGWFLLTTWDANGQFLDNLDLPSVDAGKAWARVIVAGLSVVVAYTLTRISKTLLVERDGDYITGHRQEAFYHVAQLAIYLLTILVLLALAGVNPRDLVLSAGALGVVLGLAARQTLGAVFAGFVLLFSRPFEIGDWVEMSEREGIVRDVSLFNTTLRTFDDEYVIIPNDEVTSNDIVNRSRMGRLRVSLEVGVDYETDVEEAVSLAEEAMRDLDELMETPGPRAVVTRFGDSAVVLELRFWIQNPSAARYWQAKSVVVEAVKTRFEAEGVGIPFPQRVLSTRPEATFEADVDTSVREREQATGGGD